MQATEVFYGPKGPNDKSELFDAESFLGFIRRSNKIWHDPKRDGTNQKWVFRGLSNIDYELIPSAARKKGNKLQPLIDHYRHEFEKVNYTNPPSANAKHVAASILAYGQALNDFIRLGKKLAFIDEQFSTNFKQFGPLPLLDPLRRWGGEYDGMAMGTYALLPEISAFPRPHQPVVALAQHHGVPTFLLDWTENPWTAAHFASASESSANVENDVCIWALNIDKIEVESEIFVGFDGFGSIGISRPPSAKNQYLAAQSGLLTYLSIDETQHWENTGDYLTIDAFFEMILKAWDEDKWPNVTSFVNKTRSPKETKHFKEWINKLFGDDVPILRKMVLAKEHLPDLRKLLVIEGVTKAHLMPTLDNVAATALSISMDRAES